MAVKIRIRGDEDDLVGTLIDRIYQEAERAVSAALRKDQQRHYSYCNGLKEALELVDAAIRSDGKEAVELRQAEVIMAERAGIPIN